MLYCPSIPWLTGSSCQLLKKLGLASMYHSGWLTFPFLSYGVLIFPVWFRCVACQTSTPLTPTSVSVPLECHACLEQLLYSFLSSIKSNASHCKNGRVNLPFLQWPYWLLGYSEKTLPGFVTIWVMNVSWRLSPLSVVLWVWIFGPFQGQEAVYLLYSFDESIFQLLEALKLGKVWPGVMVHTIRRKTDKGPVSSRPTWVYTSSSRTAGAT